MSNSGDNTELVNIIVLANHPRMIRQMIQRALERLPGKYQVLNVEDFSNLLPLLRRIDAHWLVVSLEPDGAVSTDVRLAMAAHPDLAVLAVSVDADRIEVHRPRITVETEHRALRDVTLQELMDILDTGSP